MTAESERRDPLGHLPAEVAHEIRAALIDDYTHGRVSINAARGVEAWRNYT